MIEINLLKRRTQYSYHETKGILKSFYNPGDELDFFADHQDCIVAVKGQSALRTIPGSEKPIIYNLREAIEKMRLIEVRMYWSTMKHQLQFEAEKIDGLITQRRKKRAIGATSIVLAGVLLAFQADIRSLFDSEPENKVRSASSLVPSSPPSDPSSPPPVLTTVIPVPSAPAPTQLERVREEISARLHQYLNPTGATLASCDDALRQWGESGGHPEQQRQIAEWQEVRQSVLLEQAIRAQLDLLRSGGSKGQFLAELERITNPNHLTLETVDQSIAAWERPEYTGHPEQAGMLRTWRRWKSLLELRQEIHQLLTMPANSTPSRR